MIYKIGVIFSFLFLCACASHKPITFKPLLGVEFVIHESFDTVDLADNEILLYKNNALSGTIKRIKNDSNSTAVQALKEGFIEAKKGTHKPVIIDVKEGGYGFVVHTDNFSTIFVASSQENSSWSEISVKKEDFLIIANTLK